MASDVVFQEFSACYKDGFVSLNLEWLERLFAVEPHDLEVLEGCQQNIVDKAAEMEK